MCKVGRPAVRAAPDAIASGRAHAEEEPRACPAGALTPSRPTPRAAARRPAARRPGGPAQSLSAPPRGLRGGRRASPRRADTGLGPRARGDQGTRRPADPRHPDRFEDAHHLVVKALEVFDRHGWRAPKLPRWLGPASSARGRRRRAGDARDRAFVRAQISNSLRRLYARREAQCDFDQPERRPLARARIAMTRLAPDFGGGAPGFRASSWAARCSRGCSRPRAR